MIRFASIRAIRGQSGSTNAGSFGLTIIALLLIALATVCLLDHLRHRAARAAVVNSERQP